MINKQVSLMKKLVCLIMLPLVFEFIFVGVLVVLLKLADDDSKRIESAKSIETAVADVTSNWHKQINAALVYRISGQLPFYRAEFEAAKADFPTLVLKLKDSCKGDDRAFHSAEVTAVLVNRMMRELDAFMIDQGHSYDKYVTLTKAISFNTKELADNFRGMIDSQAAIHSYRKVPVNWQFLILSALAIGLALSVICSVAIMRYVHQDLVARIDIMVDNTNRVAVRKLLNPLVKGDDELATLDRFIHTMDATLGANEQARQEFISMLTHDMRAPLSQVLFTLGMVIAGIYGDDQAKRNGALMRLFPEIGRLERLIGDLLSADKLDRQGVILVKEKVSTKELLECTREALVNESEGCGKTIEICDQSDCLAMLDAFQIQRVLVNLVANALKYSWDNSIVTLSCDKSGDKIVFEVIDQGSGIPEELRERIFDRFQQGDQSQRRMGFGLGLHIAKLIVEAHGGSISARNRSDGVTGAIFSFVIPIASA